MTPEKLRSYPKKVLAEMAKQKGIRGWHAMHKEQLIQALASPSKNNHKSTRPTGNSRSKTLASAATAVVAASSSDGAAAAREFPRRVPQELASGYAKDRIVLMVRDPYWLHAYWEITRHAIGRAEAALGKDWHTSRRILRVVDVSSEDTTASAERHVRDIDVHGGATNWYIDVYEPPRSFRVDLGYMSARGKFFVLARSNVVNTPRAGVSDVVDEEWTQLAEQYQRIYAMSGGFDPNSSLNLKESFEERLRRPLGSAAVTSFGSGAMGRQRQRKFWFQLDAELIVYGATQPGSRVTLQGEAVQLRADGTFTMRFSLPDSRQIIPAVASSPDGVEERTIVLAVERNTKQLEPMIHDGYD